MSHTNDKISLFKVFMSPDVVEPVSKVLLSGYITQGPQVEKFESDLRGFFKHDYVLTLNSATSGLTLALRLLMTPDSETNWSGIDPAVDEVLTTPLTCTATNWPILANGLKLRWVDVDTNCQMDFNDLESKMTPQTKVIMVVHWGGYPVDLDKLSSVLDRAEAKFGFRARVIEDCAHAFGAEYTSSRFSGGVGGSSVGGSSVGGSSVVGSGSRMIGTHGNLCVFSLQAIKHLTTGDGGLLLCPTQKLHDRAKILRWYGIDRDKRNYKGVDFRLENDVQEWGYKFHMNDLTATIGIYNLPHIRGLLQKDRANGDYYQAELSGIAGLELVERKADRLSADWLYTIRILNGLKTPFMQKMDALGIMVSQVHNRNDHHTCVKEFRSELPALDKLETEIVCIPVGWWVTEAERSKIVASVKQVMAEIVGSTK